MLCPLCSRLLRLTCESVNEHRFPAQEQISGASKIPTIVLYNRQGEVKAVGAEAIIEDTLVEATKRGWLKAEWSVEHLFHVAEPEASFQVQIASPEQYK